MVHGDQINLLLQKKQLRWRWWDQACAVTDQVFNSAVSEDTQSCDTDRVLYNQEQLGDSRSDRDLITNIKHSLLREHVQLLVYLFPPKRD